jgi:hypothetical protein
LCNTPRLHEPRLEFVFFSHSAIVT